jgi:hypothetical protein
MFSYFTRWTSQARLPVIERSESAQRDSLLAFVERSHGSRFDTAPAVLTHASEQGWSDTRRAMYRHQSIGR